MEDCGCNSDDDEVVEPDLGLPDPLCQPDDAITGTREPVSWASSATPDECDDWTDPLRPPISTPAPPPNPGNRPDKGTVFYSQEKTWTGQRDNCPTGYTGSTYSYTLPAKSFSSHISVAHANQTAQTWLDINGPKLARQFGTCNQVAVNPLRSLAWSGTSGCTSGVVALAFAATVVTGCLAAPPASKLESLSFFGVSNCPPPPALLQSLSFIGVSNCNS